MTKPFATVLDASTSLSNKTGSWRTMRPEYVKRLPPCNVTCPAGENIQQWLSLVQEGRFHEAWLEMVKNNPFPAVMGRACYHSCEQTCNRSQFDGAVNINLIEKTIGDMAISNNWRFEDKISENGKKILIIGAGPSGLSAAYFLRKMGYAVTIYEMHSKVGGMMRYGVPKYRLPREVIDAEVKRITDIGVNIVYNKKVDNLKSSIAGYDAVYIAAGASVAVKTDIEISESSSIIDAIDLFQKLEDGSELSIGKKVLVYGGGNTAIDAARSALRLGAESVKIVYRRTLQNMSAHDSEIQEALAEGVEILCLRTINSINGNKVFLDKMDFNEETSTLSKTGETETICVDNVVFAIGQSVENTMFKEVEDIVISEKGVVEVDSNLMTGAAGIFAGGDIIAGKRTITHAIGFGKKAAKCMDAYLRGVEVPLNKKHEVANFKKLNTEYFKNNNRVEVSRRGNISFEEKHILYSEEELLNESRRCFSCGNCFHCDNCYSYCPDNAIIKHEDGSLEFNYDYCKGCGMCATECPCGAIKMTSDDKE